MSDDSERRSHRGSAGWIIVGIVAGLAVIFIVIIAFSSTLFPSGPGTGGPPAETADQSATSGPGHNTTTAGGNVPSESPDEAVANTGPGTEQIPDSEVTYGRETSTLEASTAQEQGLNNTGNGTNGALENPLSENLTSLTGTSGTS